MPSLEFFSFMFAALACIYLGVSLWTTGRFFRKMKDLKAAQEQLLADWPDFTPLKKISLSMQWAYAKWHAQLTLPKKFYPLMSIWCRLFAPMFYMLAIFSFFLALGLSLVGISILSGDTILKSTIAPELAAELNAEHGFEEGTAWRHYENEHIEFYYPAYADYIYDDVEGYSPTYVGRVDASRLFITTKDTGSEPFELASMQEDAPYLLHYTSVESFEQLDAFIKESWGENCDFQADSLSELEDGSFWFEIRSPHKDPELACRRDKTRAYLSPEQDIAIFYGLGQEQWFSLKGGENSSWNGSLLPFNLEFKN